MASKSSAVSSRHGDSHNDEPWSGSDVESDLETALKHAEEMLGSFDRVNRELRMLHMVQLGVATAILLVSLLTVGIMTASQPDGFSAGTLWFIIIPLLIASTVIQLAQVSMNSARRQRERDLTGLVQISRVVRDLLPVVARTERWSELKHLTIRARIARFPISEETW